MCRANVSVYIDKPKRKSAIHYFVYEIRNIVSNLTINSQSKDRENGICMNIVAKYRSVYCWRNHKLAV